MLVVVQARLDFIQNMEYKFVELLSVAFLRSPDDLIRQSISFRYNAVKSKLSIVANRLTEVTNIVKIKNPSLLLQLQQTKSVQSGTGSAGSQGSLGSATAVPQPGSIPATLQPQSSSSSVLSGRR